MIGLHTVHYASVRKGIRKRNGAVVVVVVVVVAPQVYDSQSWRTHMITSSPIFALYLYLGPAQIRIGNAWI